MSNLTDADYTKAIDAISARREALIMAWVANPTTYLPSVHAGVLERIKGDLRELRTLQARLYDESDTVKVPEAEVVITHRPRPDWLMREHPSD